MENIIKSDNWKIKLSIGFVIALIMGMVAWKVGFNFDASLIKSEVVDITTTDSVESIIEKYDVSKVKKLTQEDEVTLRLFLNSLSDEQKVEINESYPEAVQFSSITPMPLITMRSAIIGLIIIILLNIVFIHSVFKKRTEFKQRMMMVFVSIDILFGWGLLLAGFISLGGSLGATITAFTVGSIVAAVIVATIVMMALLLLNIEKPTEEKITSLPKYFESIFMGNCVKNRFLLAAITIFVIPFFAIASLRFEVGIVLWSMWSMYMLMVIFFSTELFVGKLICKTLRKDKKKGKKKRNTKSLKTKNKKK